MCFGVLPIVSVGSPVSMERFTITETALIDEGLATKVVDTCLLF